MIKSIKASFSRKLLLLISFALILFISACGGSVDDGTEAASKNGSITISSSIASLAAGESSIITATLLDSTGSPAQGQIVTFTILSNKSGGTITVLNGGKTDANGQAIATYTAGSGTPNTEVQDNIQASVSGATGVIIVTRLSSSSTAYRLSLTADSTALTAGINTIIRATVTDGSGKTISGQAVSFTLIQNNSGAKLTILSLGVTDTSGQAMAIYTAGSTNPTLSVQDTLQASITGATGVIIITRTPSTASSTGLRMTLTADATSLSGGATTIIKASVTDGSSSPAVGQTVSFSFLSNKSGATLVTLNGGKTDASGLALATYTAGTNTQDTSLQDTIQASVTGTTAAIIITRTPGTAASGGLLLTLALGKTESMLAGESNLVTAKVTGDDGPAQGQTVEFSFVPGSNLSNGTLVTVSGTTDASGEATAIYTAGGNNPTSSVQDVIQARVAGITKAVIVTRKAGSSTVTDAASIDLAASPTSIKADGTTSSTITVNALNSSNAALTGVTVTLATNTGILSVPSVITPGNVTITSGGNKTNRTATITATAGSASAQIPIQIVDSTVTLTSSGTSLPDDESSPLTLTVTARDAGGNAVSGTPVTLAKILGGGTVNFALATGWTAWTTDINGQLKATVRGTGPGSVTIQATALGATATTSLTVSTSGNVFEINQLTLNAGTPFVVPANNATAMQIGDHLKVDVHVPTKVPATTHVRFAASTGTWDGAINKVVDVPVAGNSASATLETAQAGMATVQVFDRDDLSISDTLTVWMTSTLADADRITIQATPTVLRKSVGTTTYASILSAIVRDSDGFPVSNAPVAFSIVNPTGGGETISPVVTMTAATTDGGLSLGEARATFTSGSLPSATSGVHIRASVVGTTVKTDPVGSDSTVSGPDATVVIGGTAGSVAFGMATVLSVDDTASNYIQKMSVLVADSNGNPAPAGTVVTLSAWPIAWSTGKMAACSYDPDYYITYEDTDSDPLTPDVAVYYYYGDRGTFYNEDYLNENLILDSTPVEDGLRVYYRTLMGTGPWTTAAGTKDTYLTPTNSAAGTVPATVTTDENGVAGFELIYPKNSAIWTVARIRGSAIVQGTETVGQIIFRLGAIEGDVTPCRLVCPYIF